MNTDGYAALTEREKQTLRLIVRGHDAKSTARQLGLSVHTINERLRDARRKLEVSSSREAARRLLDREGGTPDSMGDTQFGEAARTGMAQAGVTNRARRVTRTGLGVAAVTIMLGILALAIMPQDAPTTAGTAAPAAVVETDVSAAARAWLALVDSSRWAESWAGTGGSFREMNTGESWASISQKVRVPLGAVRSRTLVSEESVPAGPAGIQLVKFRTSFATKADTIETLSLAREGGGWKVVGYYIG